jgi:hypothetical protein
MRGFPILEIGSRTLRLIVSAMKTVSFSGLQTSAKDALGDVDVSFGGSYNVLNATFFGVVGNYSVAGFTRQVPEGGATLALLGVGLIGLSVLRSRKPVTS